MGQQCKHAALSCEPNSYMQVVYGVHIIFSGFELKQGQLLIAGPVPDMSLRALDFSCIRKFIV